MKRNRIAGAVLVALLLGLTGCGGGSLGTGVRTLQGEKIKENPPQGFNLPTLWTPACDVRAGALKITAEINTELGHGAVISDAPHGCAFLLPEQAETIRLYLSDLPRHTEPRITLVEAACLDGREFPETERVLRFNERGIELPIPRWKHDRYLKLLVTVGPTEQGQIQLLNDDFDSCPFVAPEDGKDN